MKKDLDEEKKNRGVVDKLKKDLEEEKKNKEVISNLKKELDEEKKNRDVVDKLKKELEEEKKNKDVIDKLKKELEESKKSQEQIPELKKEVEKYKEEFEMKKYENEAMKTQITAMDKDLSKARKEAKNIKFSDRFFQVDRLKDSLVKNKKPMTLLFRINKENKKVEVVINRSRHGVFKVATLDILKIKLSINEKKKDQFEIIFNVSKYYYLI